MIFLNPGSNPNLKKLIRNGGTTKECLVLAIKNELSFNLPKPPSRPRIPRETTTPVFTSIRSNADNYVRNLNSLTTQLQTASRNERSLRPLLAECYKVQASASLFRKQCDSVTDIQVLSNNYCDLDCSWRTLSFQLQSVKLGRETRGYVTQLDSASDRFCAALDIDPQFDRKRLDKLMMRGTAYMQTLIDDIEIEMYGQPECERLLTEGRRLQEIIRHDSAIIVDGSYEQVLNRFNSFSQKWEKFQFETLCLQQSTHSASAWQNSICWSKHL